METAYELVNDIQTKVELLRQRKNQLVNLRSKYDTYEQNILHFLEDPCMKMNAVQGTLVLKKLREVRLARRKVKLEQSLIQSAFTRLDPAKVVAIKYPDKNVIKTSTVREILDLQL